VNTQQNGNGTCLAETQAQHTGTLFSANLQQQNVNSNGNANRQRRKDSTARDSKERMPRQAREMVSESRMESVEDMACHEPYRHQQRGEKEPKKKKRGEGKEE